MERSVKITDKEKKRMGIICCIPAIAFSLSLVYYFFLLLPLTHGHHAPESELNITVNHYSTLFIMLAVSALISAGVLLFCIVHLARREDVNTPTKMTWILVLVIFVPMSFILFWYFRIRSEPSIQQVKNIT